MKLLLIDDEEIIRRGLRAMISRFPEFSFEIFEAEDGVSAWKLVQALSPDIIILDVRMPYLDGIDFLKLYARERVKGRVIVLSGYNEFNYAQSALRYGAIDYLLKPVKRELLLQTLSRAVDSLREEQHFLMAEERLNKALTNLQKERLKNVVLLAGQGKYGFDEYLQQYDLHFPYETCVVISAVMKDYSDAELVPASISLLEESLLERFPSMLCTPYKDNMLFGIIGYDRLDKRRLQDDLEEICHKFHTTGTHLVVGVSDTGSTASQLNKLLKAAENACLEQLAQPDNDCFFATETDPETFVEISEADVFTLERYAKQEETDKLELFLNQKFKRMETVKAYINLLFSYAMELAVRRNENVMKEHAKAILLGRFSEGISFCVSLKELNEFYMDLITQIVAGNPVKIDDASMKKAILIAKEYIQKNYAQDLTLAKIADYVGMNPSYFSVLFKKECKISLINYLNHIRIERALRYLQDPQCRVYEAALAVGFHDEKYFSRIFKKNMGISPSEYREKC